MRISEKPKTLLTALLVMAFWGSIFPCIKIGYKAFGINTKNTAEILFFAGVRFLICGIVILMLACFCGQRIDKSIKKSILPILETGFFAVILHYAFTYLGLAVTDSSKTALLKQLGVLIYICFSFLFVKEERFSWRNVIGGLTGFLGIAVLNTSNGTFHISAGEILIFLASICTVISNLTVKKALKNTTSLIVTGISQLFGGFILTSAGLIFGARLGNITFFSVSVFTYICIASIIGYCLWYRIVGANLLSQLFVIKFAEPLFAGIFSFFLLGDNIWNLRYLTAILLIGMGISTR